jgi:hypothetical protein
MQARATKQKLDFEKAVADRKASDASFEAEYSAGLARTAAIEKAPSRQTASLLPHWHELRAGKGLEVGASRLGQSHPDRKPRAGAVGICPARLSVFRRWRAAGHPRLEARRVRRSAPAVSAGRLGCSLSLLNDFESDPPEHLVTILGRAALAADRVVPR